MAVEPQTPPVEQKTDGFQLFKIHPQLLDSGKETTSLINSDIMNCTVMVAQNGGETIVHAHESMEQVFIVLAGQCTFYSTLHEVVGVLGPMEGILVPRGTTSWYEKT